jgi:allantoin racemase
MARKIRIFKILPVRDGIAEWGEIQRGLLAQLASPDVEITEIDLPKAPVRAINTAYHTELVAILHVEEAIKAEQAGYDAVVMGCLDEPGVPAAKEALSIPVVGEAEAAMHFASLVGRRFSFVGGSPESRGVILDLVRKYGFESKLASIRKIQAYPLDFASEKEGLPAAMLSEARRAVEEDGADAIIGYGGIEGIRYLQEQLGVPVISPVQASVMMAESLVRLNITQSKHAYPTPPELVKKTAQESTYGKNLIH